MSIKIAGAAAFAVVSLVAASTPGAAIDRGAGDGAGLMALGSRTSARIAATTWAQQGFDRPLVKGVDVSRWDHHGSGRLNFHKMQRRGVRFVFIKASDGIPKYDAEAAYWWSIDEPAAKAARLLVGGYQYVVPTSDVAQLIPDAVAKATVAAKRVGRIRKGELPLVCDLEEAPKSLTKDQLTAWTLAWMQTAHRLTRTKPILYTYTYFAKSRLRTDTGLGDYRFWQADWGTGRSAPPQVPGLQAASFWQFSSDGVVKGAGKDRTDLNVFMGTTRQLLALAKLRWHKRRYYGL